MCPKVNKIQLKSSGTWPGIRKSGAACLGLLIEELSCSHANVGQPEALQGKVKRGMELLKRIVAEWQCNCNYFADQFPTLSLGGSGAAGWRQIQRPGASRSEQRKGFPAISQRSEQTNEILNAFIANCN